MARPTQPPKASLLGLPRELRLQIYEIVLEFPLKYDTRDFWRQRSGFSTTSNLSLPLANLAMSCSSIAYETRALICSLPANDRFATAAISVDHYDVGPMYLQRAPCPVIDLKVIEVEAVVDKPVKCAFCGSPFCFSSALESASALGIRIGSSVRSKFNEDSLFHDARALQEIQIHVRLLDKSWQPESEGEGECDKLLQEIRKALEIEGADINTSAELSTKFSFGK